jgi:hypothetical protein
LRHAAKLLAALVTLSAGPTAAMPAFARRYQTTCQTCHAYAFPELNPFGRRFKENGYQYPRGAEEAYRAKATDRPSGTPVDVLREAPLALRGQVRASVEHLHGASPARVANGLFFPARLDLIAGGSLATDLSAFASVGIAPRPFLHHFALGVHNLLGEGALNIRVGKILLTDFQRPAHRSLTRLGNPAEEVRVGGNPFALDDHHIGVHAFGRPFLGPFFYEVAVVQGTQDPASGLDLDDWKNVYGRISHDIGPHRAAVFGHIGNTVTTSDRGGVLRQFQDPSSIAGVEAEAVAPWFTVFGYLLRGKHANPFALGEKSVTYLGTRLELHAPVGERFLGITRLDGVESHDDHSLSRWLVTLNATFLALANLRAGAEATFTLKGTGGTVASISLDAAF